MLCYYATQVYIFCTAMKCFFLILSSHLFVCIENTFNFTLFCNIPLPLIREKHLFFFYLSDTTAVTHRADAHPSLDSLKGHFN